MVSLDNHAIPCYFWRDAMSQNIVYGACDYFWVGWGSDCCGGEVGVSSPHPLSSILPQPVLQLTCASYVISARLKISKSDSFKVREGLLYYLWWTRAKNLDPMYTGIYAS